MALPVAALGGALVALSFPPRSWWWAAVAGMVLVARALLGERSARRRALIGEAAGAGLFLTAFALVWSPDVPALVVATEGVVAFVLAGLVAAAAALAPAHRPQWQALAIPAGFVTVAAVQSHWPFGGLPGVGIGFGQASGPLAWTARLGGELLVIGVVAGAGAVGAAALVRWWRPALVGAAVLGLLVTAGGLAPAGATFERIDVAAVQGGGARGVAANRYSESYERQLAVVDDVGGDVDLVVLPESTAHVDSPALPTPEVQRLAAAADRLDAVVVSGVTEFFDGRTRFLNSALAWDGDGRLLGRYDKQRGVPFAEYVPGRRVLGQVVDLSLAPRDIIAGADPGVISTPLGDLGVAISFELFFPRVVREVVAGGGQLVVIPSNAASFTNDQIPAFEVAAARFRAIETGRAVLLVTPTGHSAAIGPDGTVLGETELGARPQLLRAELPLRSGRTPYVVLSDLPVIVVATASVGLLWLWGRRRRTADQAGAGTAAAAPPATRP